MEAVKQKVRRIFDRQSRLDFSSFLDDKGKRQTCIDLYGKGASSDATLKEAQQVATSHEEGRKRLAEIREAARGISREILGCNGR